jgi:hypothetical protein
MTLGYGEEGERLQPRIGGPGGTSVAMYESRACGLISEESVTSLSEDVLSKDGLCLDDPWRQLHWYAVQSKPSRESFAATNVGRLGIPVLLPKIRRRSRRAGGWGIGIKALFTGYFARFCSVRAAEPGSLRAGVLRIVVRAARSAGGRRRDRRIEARTDTEGLVEMTAPLRAGNWYALRRVPGRPRSP